MSTENLFHTDKVTLKQARILNNLTLKDVSREIGVAPSTINGWELGKPFPQVDKVFKLSKLYNIPYDKIIFFNY